MTRARALMAAVPQRVWMAVASLVVLASVGVSLVLGAGLSTWRGEVGHSAAPDVAHPGSTVIAPPKSSVIVVPTAPEQTPAATGHPAVPAPAGVTGVSAPVLPHTAAAGAPAPAAATGPKTTAAPRTARPTATAPPGQECSTPVPAHRGRGHAYGLFKKAARALGAEGCGPLMRARPGHGKALGHSHSHGH